MDGRTLHDLAADAALVIEALGCPPIVVVGHAFGQRVGRTLAADRPRLVKAMAMIAAGGRAPMKPGAAEVLRRRCSAASASTGRRTDTFASEGQWAGRDDRPCSPADLNF
jgi:pimeloyl-ACP methyl ester carboxylesterase